MTQPRDDELTARLQEGSLEALGELYNRHHHMVYRTALAITGDSEVASDLSQDVFLRLYRFADYIDRKLPLEPWLHRMTINLAYTWADRNRRGLRLLEEVADWVQVSAEKLSPHDLTEERDEWEHVQKALLTLPLAQRIVVVMYYLNDLSLQEIGQALNLPVGTVKSRLYYGRRTLKHSLELRPLARARQLPELRYETP